MTRTTLEGALTMNSDGSTRPLSAAEMAEFTAAVQATQPEEVPIYVDNSGIPVPQGRLAAGLRARGMVSEDQVTRHVEAQPTYDPYSDLEDLAARGRSEALLDAVGATRPAPPVAARVNPAHVQGRVR